MYCDICDIYFCKVCVGGYFLDEFKVYKVVLFKKWGFIFICFIYFKKVCEFYCERCENKICVFCVLFGEYE